jgi:predicted pyridoxine 5'-phosphate oxidase superfamily flavin-nucleotide-binding protein
VSFQEDFLACLQGVIPAQIVTCSRDGIPNVTVVSQCFPVGGSQIAISDQFLSKTRRNLEENPQACVQLLHPRDGATWIATVRFARVETEGPLFDAMEMQLEAIASIYNMEETFKLQAAAILDVLSVRRVLIDEP